VTSIIGACFVLFLQGFVCTLFDSESPGFGLTPLLKRLPGFMRKNFAWAVVALLIAVLSLWFLVADYRSGANLGYLHVRCVAESRLHVDGIELSCVSPWGTHTTMVRDHRGNWEIPGNDRRAVDGIHVKVADGVAMPSDGWQVSVSRNFAPDWQPSNLVLEGASGELRIASELLAGSVLKSYSRTWNWLGDPSLVFQAMLKALFFSGAILFLGSMIRRLISRRAETSYPPSQGKIGDFLESTITPTDRFVLWGVVVFAVGFAFNGLCWSVVTLWPGVHDDAALYTTVILNRAGDVGNEYAAYTDALLMHDGNTRFETHGQLYFKIMAMVLPHADYSSLLRLFHVINLLTFLLAIFTFVLFTRQRLQASWLVCFLVALPAAYGTIAVMHYLQGRPEHGIPPFLLTILLIQLWLRHERWINLLAGIQIGIVAAISPLPGVLLGFASVFVLGLSNVRQGRYLLSSVLRALVAGITWVLVTLYAFDGSLTDLVSNTVRQGSGLYSAWSPQEWVPFWFGLPLVPNVGFIFLTAVIVGAVDFFSSLISAGAWVSRILLVVSMIPIAVLGWNNGVAYAGFHYVFLAFFPAVFVWLLSQISERGDRHEMRGGPRPFWAATLPVILVVSASICVGWGLVRTSLLQSAVWYRGVHYSEAIHRIAEVSGTLSGNEVFMIDAYNNARSAIVLDTTDWNFRTVPARSSGSLDRAEAKLDFYAKYYVVLQHSVSPPEREGFRLIENHFTPTSVYLGGQSLSWYTPGYGFALYERE
jgi:hypothetical protein